ncbi:MAG TPA: hypothetical protein VF814_01440, partial [Casimicrobiaceae bacterium]
MFYLILGVGAWSEERQLLARFGAIYSSYRRDTPAFFPVFLAIPLIVIAILVGLAILLGWTQPTSVSPATPVPLSILLAVAGFALAVG